MSILVALIAVLTSGCSLFSIQKIQSPFEADPPYGKIVREIKIEGNDYTRSWIVEAALGSQLGEPYTEENAVMDLRWLSQLGTFTSIVFKTESVPTGIVLHVIVTEVSPYIPSLSMQLTQENGISLGPAFSSPNLFGTAGRASVYARFGGSTNIGVKYADPWLPGKSWLFGYKMEYFHRERYNALEDFNESTDEFLFQLRRNQTNDLRLGLRASYIALRSDTTGITLSESNSDKVPGLGVFLELDTRNGSYPTGGWYSELEVTKYGLFGVDANYWRMNADVRKYIKLPFGWRHSLAGYTLLSLTSGQVGVEVPVYMEYKIGGTNTVRGWPLGSVPGTNQWLNTLEYWLVLTKQESMRFWFIKWRMGLQLGMFGDVGTAWGGAPGREFSENFIGGFGGGLRLTIPVVVLLRIDLGYSQTGFGIKVAVGGGEKAQAQRSRVR